MACTSLLETFHLKEESPQTLWFRLLMHGSAVRGIRRIATSRRGAQDLSCLHGRDFAAREIRASASEVKGGGGYGHPLTHGPVFEPAADARLCCARAPAHRHVVI